MKKIYNENENIFSELKKDLKNLPKVNAPENFDFNLMTRIQNKNFGLTEEKRPQFNWIKFLTPSAVAVTAIILFFVFLPGTQENINSNLNQSQKLNNNSVEQNSILMNKDLPNIKSNQLVTPNSSQITSLNNTATPVKVRPPLNSSRSIRLDDYISGANGNQKDMKQGNVVRSGEEPSEFDGFYVSEKPDKITLEAYRARLDSIKKAQAKADSVKKARKLP